MKSGVEITMDNADAILDALRTLADNEVLVGIPSDRAVRDAGMEINNAELGYVQSYGATIRINSYTVTIPPRPFLDLGIAKAKDEINGQLNAAADAAFSGNKSLALTCLARAGVRASNAAKGVIQHGGELTPLSASTLASRRSRGRSGTKPLYDTGSLVRSITYVVRSKNATD